MTVNPISAITGATTDLILDDDLVRGFISSVMLEAREIGARIGIPIDQQPEDRHAGHAQAGRLQDLDAAGRGSRQGRWSSTRWSRWCKELGELTGVATPFTDALLGLARLHARVHGLY